MTTVSSSSRRFALGLLAVVSLVTVATSLMVTTTADDFAQIGTQVGDLNTEILSVTDCTFCHSNYDEDQEPHHRWAGSMMANSMRDPIFHAALAIANQDLPEAGDFCLRCHAPGGYLEGRGTPADGSALTGQDYEGITCNFCHRLVDPVADLVNNPTEDTAILTGLSQVPTEPHSGQYVVDPDDRRRGPFDLGMSFTYHPFLESPFHRESLMCASCHDVSNPAFDRVGGVTPAATDTYVLNTLDMEHSTHDKTDQFPLERTYTEWSLSDFAVAPVDMTGRFGGNDPLVSSCQDCHMPATDGTACQPFLGGEVRTDLPLHDFAGANTWVPLSIHSLDQSLDLYGEAEVSGEPLATFQDAVDRNISMLQRASDLDLSVSGSDLVVRITNQSGHKLPSGYVEGRRMWINVKFRRGNGKLIKEHGHYDFATATLTENDTTVYEAEIGPDSALAPTVGLPAAPSFHLVFGNKLYKDNRIPPRGFNNAAFEAAQVLPVGATYADGQHWDEQTFAIPAGTARIGVTIYYQTTTREYIEFLRDENTTDDTGDIAYDEWEAAGKSKPVAMQRKVIRYYSKLDIPEPR